MSNREETPLKLTEFAPIDEDEKQSTVSQYLSSFFSKFSRNSKDEDRVAKNEDPTGDNASIVSVDPIPGPEDLSEGRTLPNVMKRLSNLLALKNTVSNPTIVHLCIIPLLFSFRIFKRTVILSSVSIGCLITLLKNASIVPKSLQPGAGGTIVVSVVKYFVQGVALKNFLENLWVAQVSYNPTQPSKLIFYYDIFR